MNPSEALRQDWRLYYHQTFMQSDDGVVLVTTSQGGGVRFGGAGIRALMRPENGLDIVYDENEVLPPDEFPPDPDEEVELEAVAMQLDGENADFYCKHQHDGPDQPIRADKLKLWWPRAGAYNAVGFAQYIGRRARRSMKKSACPEHYYNIWSGGPGRGVGRAANIWNMTNGPNHLPIKPSIAVMNLGGMASVAISRHIILSYKSRDTFEVIHMGASVGMLTNGKLTLDFPTLPLSKMCEAELYGVMQ